MGATIVVVAAVVAVEDTSGSVRNATRRVRSLYLNVYLSVCLLQPLLLHLYQHLRSMSAVLLFDLLLLNCEALTLLLLQGKCAAAVVGKNEYQSFIAQVPLPSTLSLSRSPLHSLLYTRSQTCFPPHQPLACVPSRTLLPPHLPLCPVFILHTHFHAFVTVTCSRHFCCCCCCCCCYPWSPPL